MGDHVDVVGLILNLGLDVRDRASDKSEALGGYGALLFWLKDGRDHMAGHEGSLEELRGALG